MKSYDDERYANDDERNANDDKRAGENESSYLEGTRVHDEENDERGGEYLLLSQPNRYSPPSQCSRPRLLKTTASGRAISGLGGIRREAWRTASRLPTKLLKHPTTIFLLA